MSAQLLIILVALIVHLCLRSYSPKFKTDFLHIKQLFTGEDYTRLLFFPDTKMPCLSYYKTLLYRQPKRCPNRACKYAHFGDTETSLMVILECLSKARKIDICMYKFTLEDMANFLISLSNIRGVKIRIITDNGLECNENSQIPRLLDGNIEVRESKLDPGVEERYRPLMHNKFVIIDGRTCFLGSFNWTHKGLTKNEETMIKCSEANVVDPLQAKFDQMWQTMQRRASPKTLKLPTMSVRREVTCYKESNHSSLY